jgi:hypothetical protein
MLHVSPQNFEMRNRKCRKRMDWTDCGFYKKEGIFSVSMRRRESIFLWIRTQELICQASNMHFFSTILALYFASQTLACGPGLHIRTLEDDIQYAPIPASAEGIPIGIGGYGVQAFGKGAYMVTEGSYQGLWIYSLGAGNCEN